MPDFNKLTGSTDFPNPSTINTYQYANDIDYSRFDNVQMSLMLCNVPWDVGEAHVGQRTISGIGNVVYFETPAKRDEWFDAIPDEKCYRWKTKYRQLHRDLYVDVELPFDIAAQFNYLRVHYEAVASKDDLLRGETLTGKRDWFWFVREVEMKSNNTTRLYMLDDAFQTWIYDVNIEGMILERGHAPMFRTKADTYLENPLANNDGLLCEDVNFGNTEVVSHIDALALNGGDMWACIATNSNPSGDWGSKADDDWHVPTSSFYQHNGLPSVSVFAVETSDLQTFLTNIGNSSPQFKQTVQAIFFAPKNLVSVSSTFTFAGVTCSRLTSNRKTLDLCEVNKGLFGYAPKYADIAKLYTYPYAHIEVTDENGNVDVIKIENTTGNIDVSVALSLAYPFVTIDAHLLGTGGNAGATVTFRNITERPFRIEGAWYETLRSWNVPTFAVTLSPQSEYDYSTHFDRAQAKVDRDTAYTNTEASAATDKANTATMAQAAKTTADNSADTTVDNADAQQTANEAITTNSNVAALTDAGYANTLGNDLNTFENQFISDTTNAEIEAKNQSAAVGAAGSVLGGAVSGALSGGAAGAGTGLISGAISAVVSGAQTAVATNLSSTQSTLTRSTNTAKRNKTNVSTTDRTTNQNSANRSNMEATNTSISTIASNNSATQKENASTNQTAQNTAAGKTYTTVEANAERERNRAISQISNQKKQAALNPAQMFGNAANGESAATKPIGLFAHIVTQSKNAIAQTGDEFLRYGYMYEKQWAFSGNWNIGKYFTYWKLKDFWVRDLTVPDLYMDKLRFFLFGGVTIWKAPEYIGKVSIYDNFNG